MYSLAVTVAQYSGSERERLNYNYTARITGNENDYTLRYTDTDGELSGCETLIHVTEGKRITVSRMGSHSLFMILEKGVRHISRHKTPVLSFDMGVKCTGLCSELSNGILRFGYITDFDGTPSGKIEFDYRFMELRDKNV